MLRLAHSSLVFSALLCLASCSSDEDPTVTTPSKRFTVQRTSASGDAQALTIDEGGKYGLLSQPPSGGEPIKKEGVLTTQEQGLIQSFFDSTELAQLVESCNELRQMGGTNNSALGDCVTAGHFRVSMVNFGTGQPLCLPPQNSDLSACDPKVQSFAQEMKRLIEAKSSS